MHEITVPRLGWSMEEGTFGEWLKRDGDVIERGESVYVLEGEKSAQDIESMERGILRIPPNGPKPGDTVKVGQVLAFLVETGESAPFERGAPPTAPSATTAVAATAAKASSPPPAGPATRRMARGMQVDLQRVPGSGAGGKVMPDDVMAAAAPTPTKAGKTDPAVSRITISPRARRVAAALGIDYASVRGTGRTGRIRERDVREAAGGVRATFDRAASSLPVSRPETLSPGTVHPVTMIRKTIAARMLAGVRDAAPVTLTTKCDATNLVNLREQFRKSGDEIVPAYNDLITKLTAAALARHPQLIQQWHEQGIRIPEGMHIAVAVDTQAGLLAPVLRDVDRLTLRQLAAASRQMAERARAGGLSANDMQGGVFTITNLGMYGIDAFTPIINLPQSAILGVGRIVREPAVVGEAIVPRDQLSLSLTFDHRMVDGAPAARFLQTLVQAIETPGPWLMP